ncbi:uncharacterized protein LOC131551670 [Onychostoma macrolepis]|uniref:uncharacterized protein LOC131551670 n=1 Tax=Onychostoma macrolepis TaxID=369639 RepID=UPI002729F1DA|nr:uncharacterized protein LOC131551670 [Onychostoma macrolepis]XP_058650711.1 uncharacterized protein LOC131551670 [Onychostoma macrolepis]
MDIRVVSYNCRGLRVGQSDGDKARRMVVDSLLENCDILCLQETFLTMQDLDKLNFLNDNFNGAGESTTDLGMDLIKGRISGGVAIPWKKKLDSLVKVVRLDLNWCIAIQITYQDKKCIILNVYTPYECHHNEDEYLNRLAFISSFIESSTISSVYVIGDMNADISDSKSLFSVHIVQFCQDNNLILSSEVCLSVDSYTYVSEAWNTTSWLDHCISTADAHASLRDMSILYDTVTTDHIPVSMVINVDYFIAMSNNESNINEVKMDWSALTKEDFLAYYVSTDKCLSNIRLPRDAMMCSDVNCKDVNHQRDICSMYNDIVNALHGCSKPFIKSKGIMNKTKPGWSKYVAESQEAHKLWVMAGRPRQGPELEYKKSKNLRYKYAIRFICNIEQTLRADSMAMKLHNITDFWKEVRTFNSCRVSLPCTLDGVSEAENIAELWRQHYCSLFNCIQNELYNVDNIQVNDPIVMDQVISKLSQNKASGLDNISAEHLKYGSKRIAPLLAVCFTGFLIHSVLPDSMLSVLLVPVIKNKAGMVGNLDNYRPIPLACILSKVLENILLDRLNVFINSTDNQFGFKAKHGTDLCIYALKEIVNKYRDKNSSVFMCFIDASKAFDRVNHAKLFF